MEKKQLVQIKVNGRNREAMVEPRMLLVHLIRSGWEVLLEEGQIGATVAAVEGLEPRGVLVRGRRVRRRGLGETAGTHTEQKQ